MTRKVFFTVVLALLVLPALVGPVAAQTTSGNVRGTVKDTQGGALPGVAVTAYSDALVAGKLTVYSDDRGVYRFPSLPVGTYVLEADLAGFVKVKQENVVVRLGGSLALDITLPQAKVAEAVTVTAEAPVVSVVSNTVATNFNTAFIDRQPIQRDYYAMLAAAPGVTLEVGSTSSMMAYGGTESGQNAYTLDGVNVADPANGQYWVLPSIQWMQEIQIGGLGANAEYGGYTGGVINGVTKSGGNEFHGGFEFYYQPKSWTSNNQPTGGGQVKFKFTDAAISLGGPVMKDKLWFFVSGERWEQQQTPLGALAPDDRTTPRYLGKLTWQSDPSNRVWLMAERDNLHHEHRDVGLQVLPEASSDERSPNNTYALNWESLINASNFLNLKLTGYTGELNYLPYNGIDTPGRNDYNTGVYWQNQRTRTLRDKKQYTFDASWSVFADGLFGAKDSHSFKFGAVYENASATYLQYRNGGVTYYDDSSTCPSFEYYLQHPECGVNANADAYSGDIYQEWLQTHTIGLYAQDSLRLDHWTVNYGVRYGQYHGGFQSGHGNTDVYNINFVDPRIGLVWDVFGDARTAVKAHWGRYHEKMMGYVYDREASGQISIPYKDCYWNPATGKYELDSNGNLGCDLGTAEYASMGHYGAQYVDEALVTFEQQLAQDMMVGVDLIDRRFRDFITMINGNSDYTTVTATNNPLTGGTLPIYILNSPQQYVLTSDNGAYRDYKSAMLRFEKRYSHGWQVWSSLVWTDLKGNQTSGYGYIDEFKDKNGYTNADGRLAMSFNKWDYKLSGAVDLPLYLQLSGEYNYLSGMYWTPWVRVRSGLDYNSVTGRAINLLPQGSYKLPSRSLVNLRLAWNPKLAGALRMTLSAEVFNVFNSSTVIAVDSQWGTYRANKNTWSSYDTFGQATEIENPREIRAGVRLEF